MESKFVNHSTIARWESGSRLPDVSTLIRLAKVLEVDIGTLLSAAVGSDESPVVILVDDSKPVLTDGLVVLEEVMPNATITGFMRPREAIKYAQKNRSLWPFWILSWARPAGWISAVLCFKSTPAPKCSI